MSPGPLWRGFIDSLLDAAQDQLARGTTPARGSFVQAAMQVARNVITGADRRRVHNAIIA
jgi:hypothetical protein